MARVLSPPDERADPHARRSMWMAPALLQAPGPGLKSAAGRLPLTVTKTLRVAGSGLQEPDRPCLRFPARTKTT